VCGFFPRKSRIQLAPGGLLRHDETTSSVSPPTPAARYNCGAMFEITVEETFSSGHALRGYRGKCENPHGHNYRVRVVLRGSRLNSIGLLYDFKDLKSVLRAETEKIDHQYLNDLEPFREVNPSAENMARYLFDRVREGIRGNAQGVEVTSVTVFETDTTAAVYSES